MKNAKVAEVCKVVIQVCNIAVIIAQAIINAFPNKSAEFGNYSQEDLQLIKEFMKEEKK